MKEEPQRSEGSVWERDAKEKKSWGGSAEEVEEVAVSTLLSTPLGTPVGRSVSRIRVVPFHVEQLSTTITKREKQTQISRMVMTVHSHLKMARPEILSTTPSSTLVQASGSLSILTDILFYCWSVRDAKIHLRKLYTASTVTFHVDFEATAESTGLALIPAADIYDALIRFLADVIQVPIMSYS